MKKIKSNSSNLKVNSLSFLTALKVKIANSSSDQSSKTEKQRNSTSVRSKNVGKLGIA